ncbi:serine protease [Povalibacter uvarum]|uniref:Serine protease n=1 Tax=Povalibacter uvarum TaxID=732238 RepID=A0A841HQX6_9GAMM|nr:S8 family peptidase [Povalibacter uvarum]MBB6094729.1 serine protease [Povalibacter uvarum]
MKFSLRSAFACAAAASAVFAFSVGTALAQSTDGPPQRVIVKWRGAGIAAQSTTASRVVTDAEARIGVATTSLRTTATGAEVRRLSRRVTQQELNDLVTTLRADPSVEYAEEDRMMKRLLTPNDSRYAEQWHYYEANGGLNLPPAWDITTGAGITVAVLDTGYRPHADLVANIVGGYDFISDSFVGNDGNARDTDAQDPGDWYTAGQCPPDPGASDSSWHGTHVAGTVAAVSNNGSGVAGVAFGARVLPLRVLGRCGGYTSDIADAIVWASGGAVSGVPANSNVARVISMSLGGQGSCDTTTQNAINSARSRGSVVVVAAGNEQQNAANVSPASCSGVITVASVNRNGGRAWYSNFGAVVDVAAPGGDTTVTANGVLSTLNSGATTPGSDNYEFYQGTSMATPHVAGVVALMLSRNGALTPDEVETRLRSSTRAFPASCSQCGTGIVDALAAVNAATGGGGGGGSELQNGVAVSNLSGGTGAELRYTMNVPAGATNLQFQISGGTGDADLYVRFGSAPTTSTYDCRPYLGGNSETCTIAAPQTGTYHVMVRGYSSFSGLTLRGSYSTGGSGCAAGFTSYTGSLSSGGSAYLPTSAGFSAVAGLHSGRLTGPGGADFDLFLQRRSGSSWVVAARSEGSTSTESIDYNGAANTYRWRVLAYSGSGSYRLCVKTP